MLIPVPLPPGSPRPIKHEESPENLEYPLSHLNGWLTPSTRFFRRNHFAYPAVNPAAWRLTVGGEVSTQLAFTLPQLQALPQASTWATLVCSGNKRSHMEPPPEGTPWRSGAIGNAEWGGVLLRDLLRLAGPGPAAQEVLFVGADQGIFKETGEEVPYARSLPLAMALGPGPALAIRRPGAPGRAPSWPLP
ncbi:MAG: molybdopterin binding oxidoreductase [Symbiobacteriaceae bacterium]|nr:molybdopterin binding oxidoreductase [Symbiobacteriaceae bacterium]